MSAPACRELLLPRERSLWRDDILAQGDSLLGGAASNRIVGLAEIRSFQNRERSGSFWDGIMDVEFDIRDSVSPRQATRRDIARQDPNLEVVVLHLFCGKQVNLYPLSDVLRKDCEVRASSVLPSKAQLFNAAMNARVATEI